MSDICLSSAMPCHGNCRCQKTYISKQNQTFDEPQKTTKKVDDVDIIRSSHSEKNSPSKKTFAMKLKHLAARMHHCELFHEVYLCSNNLHTSTISMSKIHQGKNLSVYVQVFKLALLLLLFSNTVTASSLRKTEDVSSSIFQKHNLNFDISQTDDSLSSSPVTADQLATPSKGQKILARIFSRNKRSAKTNVCGQAYLELKDLFGFATIKVKEGVSRRRRRSHRALYVRCHTDHIKIKNILCKIEGRKTLFQDGGARQDIKTALGSILTVLQKEMKKIGRRFDPYEGPCEDESPNKSSQHAELEIRKKFFSMHDELRDVCEKIAAGS